jgi:hypothetical protein
LTRTTTVSAAVGDCVTQTGTSTVTKVACTAPGAQFKVVGTIADRTVVDAGLFACAQFTDATSSYWAGQAGPGKLGNVLCLAPVPAAAA